MKLCVVLGQNMAPLDVAPLMALTDILGVIFEIILYIQFWFILVSPID